MENELFVVWLVKTSERARAAVGQSLGDFAERDLLELIGRAASEENRLAELAAHIRAEFTPTVLPSAFTERHLRSIVDARVAGPLAVVLDCAPSQALTTLLDPGGLAAALRDSGEAEPGVLDPELLLLRLLTRLPRLAARYGLDDRDWGTFVERGHWLTPYATRRLVEHAERHDWPRDATPVRVLAGVLDGTGRRADFAPAPRFDALAVVELRRRIGLLTEALRDEASTRAEEAARSAPDLSSVALLPGWLELYERGEVAGGLSRLFTGATSVADLLGDSRLRVPEVTGTPVPSARLEVVGENTFGVWRRRVEFDVTCALEDGADPVVVLHSSGLPKDAFPPIRARLRELTGGDLATSGTTVGERLLRTQVTRPRGLRGLLRGSLRTHGPEIVQTLLLTGVTKPVEVPAPWREYLATTLPYQPVTPGDTGFPELDRINAELAAGRDVEVVR
ncbi:hypothetical protein ACFFQW_14425 [Umezawaea endophytica]|uniref:Uncharacterized protein n=1 Tax=Umezawaea endophytica TaxID=1654476 RepID=A0A9X2VKP7_9PSEU|nr:hypothetical protein [Umezawaea endophytica]MCS7477879.1 hypothetical protein [Umezawaea endophytica]